MHYSYILFVFTAMALQKQITSPTNNVDKIGLATEILQIKLEKVTAFCSSKYCRNNRREKTFFVLPIHLCLPS